ncbi:alpha/beta fold hydrolase [Geodermatophilus sp. SYSU D00815]
MTTSSQAVPGTRPGPAPAAGGPTVVLLPGAGDNAASWLPVQRALAPQATVLTHDRVGLGDNASVPANDHSLARYLAELDGALGTLQTPVVLVGHSLGGLVAAAYAARHRAAVAGLVLVDATPPAAGNDRAVAAGFAVSGLLAQGLRAGARIGLTQLLLRACSMPGYSGQRQLRERLTREEYRAWRSAVVRSFRHAAADELRAVPAAARAAAELLLEPTTDGPAFGDLPLAVVSSAAYGPRWEAWQAQWAVGSRWCVQHRTGDRSHDIHLRHPDRVVDAVRQVLAEVDRRRTPADRLGAWSEADGGVAQDDVRGLGPVPDPRPVEVPVVRLVEDQRG